MKILKENLDKGHGVSDIFRKYIMSGNEKFVVFLKNTTHLRVMKPVIEKWFLDAGFTVRLYEVHCKNTDKDKEFQAFKADTENGIKLCLSVNMLAEGIHGDIDGVIMLRETISANMYFQMIGRAFACGKKTIPLIIDLVANSQFISDAANLSFPNELRGEIEKRKRECEKEGKEYDPGFDVDEFIVMDEFMDVVSGFREIEGRLIGREWTEEEIEILQRKFQEIGAMEMVEQNLLPRHSYASIKMKAYKLGLKYLNKRYVSNEEDDRILIENYSKYGKKIIDLLPHMTEMQIEYRVKKLGLNNICNQWTKEEIEILKKWYPIEGTKVTDRLSGRTKLAIILQANRLELKTPDRLWTDEENEILRKYYLIEGTKVTERLKGRTKLAVKAQAKKLGLTINRCKLWTDEEIEILKKYYPTEGTKVKSRLSNRTKSAVIAQATKLGLKLGRKKYRYVTKLRNKYVVQIYIDGKMIRFGTYDSEDEAGKVALQKAKEYGKAI